MFHEFHFKRQRFCILQASLLEFVLFQRALEKVKLL